MVDSTGDERIAHTRRAALDRTGIRQLATRSATIVIADANLDASPTALPQIVDAVLQTAERWMTLQGVLLAADHLDNLIADTQRHLVEPTADRAENNPNYREILSMHQQYVEGMREALTRIGSTAAHMLSEATAMPEHACAPAAQSPWDTGHATTVAPVSVDPLPGTVSMRLFTCRYQRFHTGMGVPVRTTAGLPRFSLPYELGGHARLITPTWALLSLNNDEASYRAQYRQRLADAGPDAIRAELTIIAAPHPDPRLVLLCFDDLSRPDGWCHRRMFAEWWEELTGEPVLELAEPRPTALF